jgi:hypothetical protein
MAMKGCPLAGIRNSLFSGSRDRTVDPGMENVRHGSE